MRSLSFLLTGMLAGTVFAGDLPALPPPPPLPAGDAAAKNNNNPAMDLPLPPALNNNNSAELPALPPPPAAPAAEAAPASNAAPAKKTVAAAKKPAAKTASKPAALQTAEELPALPAAPAPAANTDLTSFAAPAVPEGGTAGVITGGRVNVRAGDSTKYEIVYTADPETPVTVYEKKGEWVKIGFPEKEFCYLEQQAVEGGAPTDFPEQGVARAVRNDNAKVYVRPWAGSTAVGSVKAGETVVVTGARGQYLRIRPPATAYAWVFEKFIRYNSEGVQNIELTAEEKAAREKEKETALRQKIDEAKGIRGKLPGSREMNPLLIKLRERTAMERKQREEQREAVKSLVANIDKQMAAIDAETVNRIADIERNRIDMRKASEAAMRAAEENYRPGPPPGSMGNAATGWIEHVAFWRNRPAEYRLVKGQEIICYIRSSRYNLGDYNGRRVVVNGTVEKSVHGNLNVLVVDALRLFDQSQVEAPIADSIATPAPAAEIAPVPQTTYSRVAADDRSAVKVIREKPFAPVYREPRTINRGEHVVTFQDNPNARNLQQNEDIVIIEDTPGNASRMRVGERVDVTGMPMP